MSNRPKFEDAPGVSLKRLANTWVARWRPRKDLVARGYPATPIKLWYGTDPTDIERAYVSDRANSLQSEMLVWGRGGIPVTPIFDGTLNTLIGCYRSDEDSPYRKLRYASRVYYDCLLDMINEGHGCERIADMNARTVRRWHDDWTAGKHVAAAHAKVGMLRTLFSFGMTLLEDDQCERMSVVLHKLRFEMPRPRKEWLTAEQAIAIRDKAHEMGFPSIALGQALQFELMLRQKDVIGEWVPQSEPGPSDILHEEMKWLRGLRWSEIDRNLILRHTTSKRGKDIEVDLKLAPMVMEELSLLNDLPSSGPVVVRDDTQRPWINTHFRWQWRKIATAAGVPKTIRNMDSRAGGISEATDAGADLESVRHAATHSDIGMTQKYSRGSVKKVASVMLRRVEHRNKK